LTHSSVGGQFKESFGVHVKELVLDNSVVGKTLVSRVKQKKGMSTWMSQVMMLLVLTLLHLCYGVLPYHSPENFRKSFSLQMKFSQISTNAGLMARIAGS